MTHKVFIGVVHDPNLTPLDRSVMLTFPNDDFQFQIVVRPKFIEANGIKELRNKLIAEIDAKLGYVPGMASAVATADTPAIKSANIDMAALVIDGPVAKQDDMFLDLTK
jgi:hypothetical protein